MDRARDVARRRAIAGSSMSYYLFEGLRRGRPHRDLQITSTCFDGAGRPGIGRNRANGRRRSVAAPTGKIPKRSGFFGLDDVPADGIAAALEDEGFALSRASRGLAGREAVNICNRTALGVGCCSSFP
jgi:phage replication-related protein YjqB (UPF0714/DUF867 family)